LLLGEHRHNECEQSAYKTVTRQRRDCDLNPGPSAPESSTLTTRLPSHLSQAYNANVMSNLVLISCVSRESASGSTTRVVRGSQQYLVTGRVRSGYPRSSAAAQQNVQR